MSEPEVLQFLYHFDPIRPELITNPDSWTKGDVRIGQAHFANLKQGAQDGIVLLAGRSLDGVG